MDAFMKGIEAQVDRMVANQCAESGMMTLGELDARFEAIDPDLPAAATALRDALTDERGGAETE